MSTCSSILVLVFTRESIFTSKFPKRDTHLFLDVKMSVNFLYYFLGFLFLHFCACKRLALTLTALNGVIFICISSYIVFHSLYLCNCVSASYLMDVPHPSNGKETTQKVRAIVLYISFLCCYRYIIHYDAAVIDSTDATLHQH